MSILIAKGRSFSSHRTDAGHRAPSQRLALVAGSALALALAILVFSAPSALAQASQDITVNVSTPWGAPVGDQFVNFKFPGSDATFDGSAQDVDRRCKTSAAAPVGKCTLVLSPTCAPNTDDCFTADDLGVAPTGTARMLFYANASKSGYVTTSSGPAIYDARTSNTFLLKFNATLGIIGRAETGGMLPPASALDRLTLTITDASGQGSTVTDGIVGSGDLDGALNNEIWVGVEAATAATYDLLVQRAGFLDYEGQGTISESAGGVNQTIKLQYLTRVDVYDERGDTISDAGFARLDGKLPHAQDGNSYFFTTRGGALQVATPGFVSLDTTKDTALANLPSTPTSRTHVKLSGQAHCIAPLASCVDTQGSIVGRRLDYTVKVILKDEVGDALAPLATVKINQSDAAARGADTYYVKAKGPGALTVTATGYAPFSTTSDTGLANVIPSANQQTVITLSGEQPFTGTFQPGSTITGSGLKFLLKVVINDELGHPINSIPAQNVRFDSCQAAKVKQNAAYLTCTGSNKPLTVDPPKMVKQTTANFNLEADKAQIVRTVALAYPLNVIVLDELNLPITDGVSTVTYGGQTPARVVGEYHYFSVAGGTNNVEVSRADMLPAAPISVTVASPPAAISKEAVLKYRLRVDVNDAFGNGLTAVSVAFGNAPIVQSGSSYFVRAAYSAAPTPLTVTHPGYLRLDTVGKNAGFASVSLQENAQTLIRLTGTSGCASWNSCNAINTQFTKIGSGLEHAVRVHKLQNELGATIPQTSGSVSCPDSVWVADLGEMYCAVTNTAQIVAQPTGYVRATTTVAANDHTVKSICFGCPDNEAPALKFQLKVTVKDELGILRHGDPTGITYGTDGATASDGSNYYFAPTTSAARTISITRLGFVNAELKSIKTMIDTGQTQVTFSGKIAYAGGPNSGGETITTRGLQYPLKVVVNDQFDNNITSTRLNYAGTPSVSFANQAPQTAPNKPNEFYFATIATTGQPLSVASEGFRWDRDAPFASITTSSSEQKTINLSGTTQCTAPSCGSGPTSTGRGLYYPLRVIVNNELAQLVAGASVSHAGIPAAVVNAGAAYIPSLELGALQVTAPGMVNLDTSIDKALESFSPPASGTLQITLAGQTPLTTIILPDTTQVTASGLRYPFKIRGVFNEVGEAVGAIVTCDDTPAIVAGTIRYCPASQTLMIKASASVAGYLPASLEIEPDHAHQQVVVFGDALADVNAPPLGFPFRVFVGDELGEIGIEHANVTWRGELPTTTHGSGYYFLGAGAGKLAVNASGFVDLNTTWENTALSNVRVGGPQATTVILSGDKPATQGIEPGDFVTGTGLKYRLKVILHDELGQSIDGATLTYANSKAAFTKGNVSYFATNLAVARLNASAPGYVNLSANENPGLAHLRTVPWNQTTIRLTNATPAIATAEGGVINVTGLRHAIRIESIMDDAGSLLSPGDVVNITCGGVVATFANGRAYCRATTPTYVNATAKGHVNASTFVTPGLTTSKMINFTGLDGVSALNRSIRVVVVRSPDNATISNATVTLTISGEVNRSEAVTDQHGRAFFARTGSATINVQAAGYKNGRCTLSATSSATTSCVIQLESLTPIPIDTTPPVRIEPFTLSVSSAPNMTLTIKRMTIPNGTPAVVYVSYSENGIGFGVPMAIRTTNETRIDHAFAQDGAYQFWAFAAGQEPADVGQSSAHAKIVIDRAPPTISVQGAHDISLDSTPTLAFTIADGNLAEVVARIDGVAKTPTLDGGLYSLDVSKVAPGAHVLNITAKDTAGNLASRAWEFNVTAAKLGLTVSPIPDVLKTKLTVSAESTGPLYVTLELFLNKTLLKTSPVGKATADLNPASLPEGTHNVTIVARDDHGQTATWNRTFLVDRTPPTIYLDENSSSLTRFRGNAMDSDAIVAIKLLADGSIIANTTNTTFDFAINESTASRNLVIEAIDRAGNVARFNVTDARATNATPPDELIEQSSIDWNATNEANESTEGTASRGIPFTGIPALVVILAAAAYAHGNTKRRRQ